MTDDNANKGSSSHAAQLGVPDDLYDGIAGSDPETIAQARADRQRGLLEELRSKKRDVQRQGHVEEAQLLAEQIQKLRQYFEQTP